MPHARRDGGAGIARRRRGLSANGEVKVLVVPNG